MDLQDDRFLYLPLTRLLLYGNILVPKILEVKEEIKNNEIELQKTEINEEENSQKNSNNSDSCKCSDEYESEEEEEVYNYKLFI